MEQPEERLLRREAPFLEERLAALGFFRQPFPVQFRPPDPCDFMVNQPEARREMANIIEDTQGGHGRVVAMLAGLRDGKSHFLQYFRWFINKHLEESAQATVVYAERDWDGDIGILLRIFLREVAEEKLRNCILSLTQASGSIGSGEMSSEIESSTIESATEVTGSMIMALQTELENLGLEHDLSLALAQLCNPDTHGSARWYLMGNKLTPAEARAMGLDSQVIEPYRIAHVFADLLKVMGLRYKAILLLVDELEPLTREQTGGQAARSMKARTNLRRLMDLIPRKCSMIFSCDPRSWTRLFGADPALTGRFASQITLSPITTVEDGELYLTEYLKRARRPGVVLESDLAPFTRSIVAHIIERTRTREGRCSVGIFLKQCFAALDSLLKSGEDRMVEEQDVEGGS